MWMERDLRQAKDRIVELETSIRREQSEKSQLNDRINTQKSQYDNTVFEMSKELDEKNRLIEDKNNRIDQEQHKYQVQQEKYERCRDRKDELRR